MSFYRVGQNRRKRPPVRKRPGWDDTVQDLTVHRATPEEILLRKEAHKSKNHLSVKLEKLSKENQKNKLTGTEAHQLAIMKEILYDQNQLQEVLAKSDTMMAVVKDLFGDDPKRFMGFPNVTTAPNHDGDHNRLVASVPDIYTRAEKLSDSLMDQSALNDELDTSDSEDEVDCPDPISYESRLNLQHFQEYLQEEKSKTDHMTAQSQMPDLGKTHSSNTNMSNIPKNTAGIDKQSEMNRKDPAQMLPLLNYLLNQSDGGQNQAGNLPDHSALASLLSWMAGKPNPEFQTPTKKIPLLPTGRTPPSAMNDTKKIKRSKKVVKSPRTSPESINTTTSMNDLRKVLQELESEIATYEHQTGRLTTEETHKTETFSGYTVALVTAVSRLTRYLRETDLRVRAEATLREQLTQDVYQLRTIIDALATDLILTQEEYGKLYSQYKQYRETTETQLMSLHNQVRELKHLVTGKESEPASWNYPENQKIFQQPQSSFDCVTTSKLLDTSKTSTPLHDASSQSELDSGSYWPLPTHLRPTEAAAVMLSPPVRKTRVQTSADNRVQLSKRQTSLVDLAQLTNEGTTHSADPPRLTQTPPVMNTVSVPRPIPLVQSNLIVPLTFGQSVNQVPAYTIANGQRGKTRYESTTEQPVQHNNIADLVRFGDETEHQLQQLQEMVVEETLNHPDLQNLMQIQIAELNRQQEEARLRLLSLLDNQRLQQQKLQDQLGAVVLDSSSKNDIGWRMHKLVQQPVSPPISPISQKSDQQALGISENLQQAGQERSKTVSMAVTNLDGSEESLSSPRPEIVLTGK